MKEEYYKRLRNEYLPKNLKIIFIAESPPAAGTFFYNPDGEITEQLFSAMMKLISHKPKAKKDGLLEFANKGLLVVDAVYQPVNDIGNYNIRNEKILKNLPSLIDDLRKIIGKKRVKIILIKANICRMLEAPLKEIGFKVINNGVIVPFPGNGQQNKFYKMIKQTFNKNVIF